MRTAALQTVNKLLAPANLKVDSVRTRAWDRFFEKWIAEAQEKGIDPNDIGDVVWEDDALSRGLADFYSSRIRTGDVVIELGPGSGRLTRHIIGKVKRLILVDFSPAVTTWLTTYLAGKGEHEIILITKPGVPVKAPASVDVVFAHGVVEHFDQEVLAQNLIDLQRVLKRGGEFVFTFNDLSSAAARDALVNVNGEVAAQRFRFYEPAAIERLASMFGFTAELTITGQRISFAVLTKE